jgi:integrase
MAATCLAVQRAKRPQRVPVVLTRTELRHVLAQLEGTVWLLAGLSYGGGLRLMECLRLRVKDIDFDRGELTIRDGKGQKDRVTLLPRALLDPLRTHLSRVRHLHNRDLAEGYGCVYLPFALDRKYPKCEPRVGLAVCVSGGAQIHRSSRTSRAQASRQSRRAAAGDQRRSARSGHPQARQRSYAPSLLRNTPARVGLRHSDVQELLGHSDVKTTMIYTHVLQRGGLAVKSPLDP